VTVCRRSTVDGLFATLFKVALAATLWHFSTQVMAQKPKGGPGKGAQKGSQRAGGSGEQYSKMPGARTPGSDDSPDAEAAKAPTEQPLPDNVTDWVREHYRRARRDGDQRLKDAVELLGKQFKGVTKGGKDDKAAKLLTNLLRFEEPKDEAPAGAAPARAAKTSPGFRGGQRGGPRSGYPGAYPGQPGAAQYAPLDADTIKAIVHALAVNDSKTAQETLNQVLRGAFKSDDDRAATEGLLESLVALPSPEHDDVVFRVLTNPNGIRPAPREPTQPGGASGRSPGASGRSGAYGYQGAPARGQRSGAGAYARPSGPSYGGVAQQGQAKMTGAEMQSVAMALVNEFGSQAIRTRLADHLAQATTADDVRQTLLPMLYAAHPRNLPAQTILYRSEALDKGSRDLLEGYFVKYSSAALAMLMRVPEELPSRAAPGTTPQGPARGPYGPGRGPAGGQKPTFRGSSDAGRPQNGIALLAVQAQGSSDAPGNPDAPSGFRPSGAGAPGQRGAVRGTQPGAYPGGGAPASYGAATALTGPLNAVPGFDREVIAGLASPLWAADFTKVVGARLETAGSLETDSVTIVLATTIPIDAVRAKVYRLLEQHYLHQGPQVLETGGLAGNVLSDPGLLVTMKLLPRKEARKPRPTPTRTRDRKGGRGEQSGGLPAPAQPAQQPAGPGEEWTGAAERLVRAFCERLGAAGNSAKGGSAEVAEKRLVQVPPVGVQVVSEYHFEWPDDLAEKGKLSGVALDPMTIHYVRFQGTSTINKVLAFYGRQLGKPTEHTVADGMWLESLRFVPDSRRRFSVDVLVTRADANRPATPGARGAGAGYAPRPGSLPATRSGGADASRGGGQPGTSTAKERYEQTELIVEVLAVQTNDFAAGQEAAEEPAAAKPEAAKEKE
jgi:hypothetical protein